MNEQQFKALPEAQRKAHQERLQALGLYVGSIDGSWGKGTKAAFEQEAQQKSASEATSTAKEEKTRADKLEADRIAVELAKAQAAGKSVDTTAESAKAERDRKAAKDAEAKSAYGIGLTTGSSVAAPLAGYVGGRVIGSGLNKLADNSQRSKNAVLQATAEDRTSGLTTRDGARIGATRSGAMPSENALLRVGGRMLPHTITGVGMMGKGGVALSQVDPEAPIEDQAIKRATGLGFIGAGVGTLEQGANYAINPGVAPDARSIAIMESNQLRRNNQGADAQAAPRQNLPGSRPDMMAQAKRYNIPGRSKMNAEELRVAVGKAVAETPAPRGGAASKMLKSFAGPLAAGAAAYAMTPDRAQAADGSDTGGNQAEALTNAGMVAGGYAGANKLLGMLPQAAKTAIAPIGDAVAPSMIDSMTDYSQDEVNQGQNFAARNLPSFMRAGGVENAYQMAQVPEANPQRQAAPAPQEAPQDFDSQLAELSALLSQVGAAQAPGPIANAIQSQKVAQAPDPWRAQMPANRLLGR